MKSFYHHLIFLTVLIIGCQPDSEALLNSDNNAEVREDSRDIRRVEFIFYTRQCEFSDSDTGKVLTTLEQCLPFARVVTAAMNTRPVHEEVVAVGYDQYDRVVGYDILTWGVYFPEEKQLRDVVIEEVKFPDRSNQVIITNRKSIDFQTYMNDFVPKAKALHKNYSAETFNGLGSTVGKVCQKEGWNCQDLAADVWNLIQEFDAEPSQDIAN